MCVGGEGGWVEATLISLYRLIPAAVHETNHIYLGFTRGEFLECFGAHLFFDDRDVV